MRLLLLLVMTGQDNRQERGNDTANSLRQPQTEYQTETQTQGMQYLTVAFSTWATASTRRAL